jgi:16S rRNA C1402 (ribose-2'-O) methylase RsmI
MTKKFEEVARGSVSQMMARYSQSKPRGEVVIVLEGRAAQNS